LNKIYKNFLLPTGLLSGTIIGAGVFALPYVFKAAGLALGLFYLILGGLVYSFIHLLYADIIVRTPGEHRFVGYVERYLGAGFKWLAVLMSVLEMIFVMAIYLVLSVSFANLVLSGFSIYKVLTFWILGSLAIFLSLKKLAFIEFLIAWGMIFIIALIFVLGLGHWPRLASQLWLPNFSYALFPLAPILFALGGRVAIPSVVKYFHLPGVGHKHSLIKRTVIVGTLIPAIVYGLFVFGILGLTDNVTEDAVTGLVGAVSPALLAVMGILGLLALWSSYIVVGLDVNQVLLYDLKIARLLRLALVVAAPLALYFLSSQDFLGLISFVGGIFLGLEGIFIGAVWLRAKKLAPREPALISKNIFLMIGVAFLVFAAALVRELTKIF